MYDTSGAHSVCHEAPPDADISLRIDRLRAEVARVESGAAASGERETRLALSMLEPIPTEEAYAWFGSFLGLFPPFAIFARVLVGGGFGGDGAPYWGFLFALMNLVCCLVGRKFARRLARASGDPRARSWPAYLILSAVAAAAWALVTGGLGGAVAFGVGAVVGVGCALPVALAGFPLFAVLHRIQSHGGMIEERQLWPLAFGIPVTAAALILTVGQ